ncbi:MAG: AAA family ATPase [Deltaproteobacteria bacterium]|nr:AAA family ATPase [Deltaproteobacteria bacterium]
MLQPLPFDALRWTLDSTTLDLGDQGSAVARPGALGQERALRALEVGLGIAERGFNLFVVGLPGTGRMSTVRTVLTKRAATEAVPDDWVLLYNFEERDRPRAIRLAPGTANKLKKAVDGFIERLETTILKAFETESYHRRREVIAAEHEAKTDAALADVETEAEKRSFSLRRTPTGITLGPLREGAPLTEEEFNALPAAEREQIEAESAVLEEMLDGSVRVIRRLERETEEMIEKLDREVVKAAIEPELAELKARFGEVTGLPEHFAKVQEDILDCLDAFKPTPEAPPDESSEEESPAQLMQIWMSEDDLPPAMRYKVNVFVDNSKLTGAPVIEETHPTPFNLLGRVEYRMRGSETLTDFTRIKPGALHRANGGYLLVDAIELLRDGNAWEGLKRALKNRKVEIEDPGEAGRMVSMASLRPEPIPLRTKVVVVGTPDVYYLLSRNDPDFGKLFKVKVDFDTEVQRNEANLQGYARFICGLAHEEKLLPLAPTGVARAVEHAARLASRRDKLSTLFGEIADLLREASFYAARRSATHVEAGDVRAALDARTEREAFLEFRLREEIENDIVRIELSGERVGQINGLTVVDLGSYSFGHPARVTATTGFGGDGVMDLERETELGGPIHTKGVLILAGLISNRFGATRALHFSGRICIEQSYIPIDGDSASLAEACALLSSLGGFGIGQRFAITGSIDQWGTVQAVGGTNDKLEGFFAVCKSRGLDGSHAAVIPQSNVEELMLREEIVEACRQHKFSIYAVSTIEEALELLCGRPFGNADEQGNYPIGTLGHDVASALDRFAEIWRRQRRP